MLVLGTVFQCLGPITTVAALLSSKPIFNNPLEKREEANAYVIKKINRVPILKFSSSELGHASPQEIVIF
jgi:hypothetical protein